MKKFIVVLELLKLGLKIKKSFEVDTVEEIPKREDDIFIHDFPCSTYVRVRARRHCLEDKLLLLVCDAESLDNMCLASLKTSGWEIYDGIQESLTVFNLRCDQLKAQVMWNMLF